MNREQTTHERLKYLIRLISEDGLTNAGEVPVEHVRSIQNSVEKGQMEEVAKSHKQGRGPPDQQGRGPPDHSRGNQ
jgi:hypothetical protein